MRLCAIALFLATVPALAQDPVQVWDYAGDGFEGQMQISQTDSATKAAITIVNVSNGNQCDITVEGPVKDGVLTASDPGVPNSKVTITFQDDTATVKETAPPTMEAGLREHYCGVGTNFTGIYHRRQ